jgi:hypothetical protein
MQNILNALIFLLHELIENCNLFIVITLLVSYYIAVTVVHLRSCLLCSGFFFAKN